MKKYIITLFFLSIYIFTQNLSANSQICYNDISSNSLQQVVCYDDYLKKDILAFIQSKKCKHQVYVLDFYQSKTHKHSYRFAIKELNHKNERIESMYFFWEVNNIVFFIAKEIPDNVFLNLYRNRTFYLLPQTMNKQLDYIYSSFYF